ncbi:MAG TPA: NAD-dependent epimerase/dehydratase family protein [Bryobacteraceae bacterium]|nr:NAD-dependent epimerase/dehydratase family protein [Bryobacteraceae bacterium]
MRVLVTGGQGCIGAWVIKRLLDRHIDVVMFDIDETPKRLPLIASRQEIARIAFIRGSVEDIAAVKAIVKQEGITHIVHLAAVLIPFCQQHPVAGAMVNVIGTLNLFEAARDAGRSVRVVYASSAAVWGPEEAYGSQALSEEDALKPATHYGVFKQANEGNARVFYSLNGISSVGLRPWTVYGVGRDQGMTADPTLAIRALANGEPFQIRLSGFMDLQYVADVADTFIECLLSPLEGAHVFNLAGEVIHMDAFHRTLVDLDARAAELVTISGPQVPVAFRMDDAQLRAKIGNLPKTSLQRGIAETYERFLQLRQSGA